MELLEAHLDSFEILLDITEDSKVHERKRRLRGQDPWNIYGSTLDEYSCHFRRLLEGDNFSGESTFSKIFKQRQQAKGSVTVLDYCADGAALRDPSINYGIAVTLNDFRSPEQRLLDSLDGREVIEASLLEDPWYDIKDVMTGWEVEKIDYILMRPISGWDNCAPQGREFIDYLYYYLRRSWPFLNPDDGQMFVKLPWWGEWKLSELQKWIQVLSMHHNIDIVATLPPAEYSPQGEFYEYYDLLLARKPEDPIELPQPELIQRQVSSLRS